MTGIRAVVAARVIVCLTTLLLVVAAPRSLYTAPAALALMALLGHLVPDAVVNRRDQAKSQ